MISVLYVTFTCAERSCFVIVKFQDSKSTGTTIQVLIPVLTDRQRSDAIKGFFFCQEKRNPNKAE